MELQKQPILATKEQLRLAELTQTGNEVAAAHDDIALQKRVKKVIELTRCTPSQAEVALIDSEQDVEDAVSLLLDNPEELVLWSQQGNKTRKPKSGTQSGDSKTTFSTHNQGRRVDSQRNRTRYNEQQTGGGTKQFTIVQSRSARSSQARDQDSPSGGPRTRSERPGFKGGQSRGYGGGGGGGYRRDRKDTDGGQRAKLEKAENGNEGGGWNEGYNGWTNGGTGGGGDWGDSTGWGDDRKSGADSGFSTAEGAPFADSSAAKDEEWKNGPRVFMPSSAVATITDKEQQSSSSAIPKTSSSSNWPALDNFAPATVEQQQTEPPPQKPKTFAAVAATAKKVPLPPPQKQQAVSASATDAQATATDTNTNALLQKEPSVPHSNLEVKRTDEPVVEWSSSIEWGNSLSPQPAVVEQPDFTKHPPEPSASTSSSNAFITSGHSNINQEYTDQLKNAIGLVQSSQQQQMMGTAQSSMSNSNNSCTTAVDYMQQRMQQLQQNADLDQPQEKVEFVTGDSLPPTSTSYQFGFHFDSTKDDNTWGPQPHISTVELDRSVLKNSTGTMLSTMTSIPTTSSSVSAHFNAASQQQQAQAIESHQQRITNGSSRAGAAPSCGFTDPAAVNFPPSNGPTGAGGLSGMQQSTGYVVQQSNAAAQQMQMNKPLYTPTNPSMVTAPPHLQQHLQQQQPQTMFHQTSAAPAVAQFPSYNMPYMYSPVAAAPTLQGPNTELDRLLLQQYGPAYSQFDLQQMGAMSIGPPTTLAPNHRTTLDSYMDNKFGQQQNVGQGGNAGPYQQAQQGQQQRNLGQSEAATLLGGPPGHVGPPPGFGMPTAPTQTSYMPQPANLQSLFQMPTYHHPYHQHQYMMSNANRLQTAQRPAQTSPPEGNVPSQRRGGGNDPQGYGGESGMEQHSSGGGGGPVQQPYGNNFNNKYRSYM